jgi:hypothetical protein
MSLTKAYDEVIDLIASAPSLQTVADYPPSEEARARVTDLVAREKTVGLTPDETNELETALRLERIMRLAKARARQRLASQ